MSTRIHQTPAKDSQKSKGFFQNTFDATKALVKGIVPPIFGLIFRTTTATLKTSGELTVNLSKSAYKGSKRISGKPDENQQNKKGALDHTFDGAKAVAKGTVPSLSNFLLGRVKDFLGTFTQIGKNLYSSAKKGYERISQPPLPPEKSSTESILSAHQVAVPAPMANDIRKSLSVTSENNSIATLAKNSERKSHIAKGI